MVFAVIFLMIAMIAYGRWTYLDIIKSSHSNELTDEEKTIQKVFIFNDDNDDTYIIDDNDDPYII